MTENKNHWYDGWFYDRIIAPNQDKLFGQIKNLIEPDSTIIDVGCGTGRLEFTLAEKCKSVLGIDLSEKNIDMANSTLIKNNRVNIFFQHNNISEIIKNGSYHFDYAILTNVIHEVDKEERNYLLIQIAGITDKIIIGDYIVPKPKGIQGFLSGLIEFLAGKEHYRNYKSYMADGGLTFLAEEAGLKIMDELSNHSHTNHIDILEK